MIEKCEPLRNFLGKNNMGVTIFAAVVSALVFALASDLKTYLITPIVRRCSGTQTERFSFDLGKEHRVRLGPIVESILPLVFLFGSVAAVLMAQCKIKEKIKV